MTTPRPKCPKRPKYLSQAQTRAAIGLSQASQAFAYTGAREVHTGR